MAINTFRATVIFTFTFCLIFVFFRSSEEPSNRVRRAATPNPITSIVYWGQDRLGDRVDAKLTEPSLLSLCSGTSHEVVILSFVKLHFSTNGLPALSLANHCKTTTFNSDKFGANFYPLICPEVASHITQCQAMGKKVLISISPMDSLKTSANAVKSAENIWNYFLGGSADKRPFGNLVLDGVDLFFRTTETALIADFALALNRKMTDDPRTFYLTVSCRGQFPDANYGPIFPNNLLTANADKVSMIIIHAMGSPDFTYRNKDIMYGTFKKWFDWSTRPIYLALPGHDGYVDDSPGDYIPPANIMTDEFIATIRKMSNLLKGFAIFEGSAEMASTPCLNDNALIKQGFLTAPRKYGDLLRSQFLLPVTTIGNNTPSSSWCDPYIPKPYNGNTNPVSPPPEYVSGFVDGRPRVHLPVLFGIWVAVSVFFCLL